MVINDLTERRLAAERIAHLTSHDALTGLANRAAFGARLSEALERAGAQGVATICIDIDQFKEINDAYGHSMADRVLEATARRLKEAAGEAFLARVGGDEFNLIVTDTEQPAAAAGVAAALLSAVAGAFEIDGAKIKIGLSIGVAVGPHDGADAATLLANAEAALDRAKQDGRGAARFFEPDMDKRLRERRALEHELKAAIERGQLRLHYQPQTDVSGRLLGFEALARWPHPVRGNVPPAVFIGIAEGCGAILDLGAWTLREACREAASWPGGLSIAVNLSPIQFRQSDLFALIRDVLAETGLAGERLELEITEGVLIDDQAMALDVLQRIKGLGVRIAMDDFGTGYSSLAYLQSFPFDKIKIDRSFIANLDTSPNAAAIIRAVLGLSRGLNIPVIAEGVETDAQVAFLEQEGCDELQGYLMGRPRPIEEYASWIRNGGAAVYSVRWWPERPPPRRRLGLLSFAQAFKLLDPRARKGAQPFGRGGDQRFDHRQQRDIRVPARGRSDPAGHHMRRAARQRRKPLIGDEDDDHAALAGGCAQRRRRPPDNAGCRRRSGRRGGSCREAIAPYADPGRHMAHVRPDQSEMGGASSEQARR